MSSPVKHNIMIQEVWWENLESEFKFIISKIDDYPYISMDTEYPGVVHGRRSNHPAMPYIPPQPSDYYTHLKSNVDELKLIQLGLTLTDSSGNLPTVKGSHQGVVWQFNFSDFDLSLDRHAAESIELLKNQGIDFERNLVDGMNSARFAELMMSSGLVCNESVTWVTFHGAYDFGYLVKILTGRKFPGEPHDFFNTLRALFGDKVFDLKHVIKFCGSPCPSPLLGGLEKVAKTLEVDRVAGKKHQAGSDSLLTWHAFEKMRDKYFPGNVPEKYAGILCGLEGYHL